MAGCREAGGGAAFSVGAFVVGRIGSEGLICSPDMRAFFSMSAMVDEKGAEVREEAKKP
jgi:hypothetical protein